jgi:hypothetical protein
MERERSPWSSHRQSRRRHDRHTTPSPDLRQILLKRKSIDRDRSQSRERGSSKHGSSSIQVRIIQAVSTMEEQAIHQEHRLSRSDKFRTDDVKNQSVDPYTNHISREET